MTTTIKKEFSFSFKTKNVNTISIYDELVKHFKDQICIMDVIEDLRVSVDHAAAMVWYRDMSVAFPKLLDSKKIKASPALGSIVVQLNSDTLWIKYSRNTGSFKITSNTLDPDRVNAITITVTLRSTYKPMSLGVLERVRHAA